jgi:hypothetical protein
MTDVLDTSSQVKTGLYIGGAVRESAQTLTVADTRQPGTVVGPAAAGSEADVGRPGLGAGRRDGACNQRIPLSRGFLRYTAAAL